MAERNISVAETDISKEKTDFVEDAPGEESQRHIGFGGNQPHPRKETQKDIVGVSVNEEDVDLVDWDGPSDPENPYVLFCFVTKYNWSPWYKWVATLTTCFISILTGFPAGAYGAASEQMLKAWHIDDSKFPYLDFGLVTWNMGAAVFPLLFVPLTESTGRLPGYFVGYVLFMIWLIPCALAPNFATILVARFFGGGASSTAINLVGGSITDIWKGDKERSLPMSIFAMTGVLGIALGPFVGGAIQTGLNWRWIYWIQLIIDAGFLPVFYLILKETRGDVILAKRAAKMRKNGHPTAYAKSELNKPSLLKSLQISFMRPTKMLATEFVVQSFTLWVSFAWGILFLFQSGVPIVFQSLYGYNTFQVTLIQLSISVGAILANFINPIQDHLYLKSAVRNMERPGKPIPEARLYFAVPGSVLFAVGMFWFGWSSYSSLNWIVPTLGVGCVGIGVFSIYLAAVNYLADAYEKYAASALTAASLGRNVFGAFLPLATPALYKNLGFHWASSLVGFIALALSLVPVVLLVKGEAIRARSPFMLDSAIDEEEATERRASMAQRGTVDRKTSAVLPWSHIRTANANEV